MPIRKANVGYLTNSSIWLNYNHLTKPIVNIFGKCNVLIIVIYVIRVHLEGKSMHWLPWFKWHLPSWQRLPKYPSGSQQCTLLGLDNDMQWGLGRRENFHFLNEKQPLKVTENQIICKIGAFVQVVEFTHMQRYLAVDFWWLISTQMPQPPTPPPGITTNSLLG